MKKKCNEQKTVTDMLDINPAISIIVFNVNYFNVPIKRQSQSEQIKNRPHCMLSTHTHKTNKTSKQNPL